jgi:phage gp36-like protein
VIRKLAILLLVSVMFVPTFTMSLLLAEPDSPRGNLEVEGFMSYCTQADLEAVYGEDRIAGWSRMEPAVVERAAKNASAEIDGYLISGGYTVPLPGPPENLKKYCIDIATANLILSAGILENDPGGKAIFDEAKNARIFLTKVAEGKFKIPGYVNSNEEVSSPPGGVMVSASSRMDLTRY